MTTNYSAKVEGMTCGNCALTISRMLAKKGMQNISANAASGEINFTMEEGLPVAKIYDAIDGLGYHVIREEHDHDGASMDHSHHHAAGGKYQDLLLLICAVLTVPLLAHMFISWPLLHNPYFQLALATPVFAIGCWQFLPSAMRSLKNGIPNMDVLIMIGAIAAYGYSIIGLLFYSHAAHQYIFFETAASVITLVMTGNWLEVRTVKSTTASISELSKLQPAIARLVQVDSIGKETIVKVDAKHIRTDDLVQVNNGDSIPVDGTIVSGTAEIDEHMITGESMPAEKTVGDSVTGGTLLNSGSIRLKATTVGKASVLNNIIKMVQEAQAVKPPMQKLADRISAIFVPAVLSIAIATFLINYFFVHIPFAEAMMRAIAVLVISCPCAMGLATPAAVAVGLGRAARNGILVKGGDTLEKMKLIKQIVFDKTGTLTTGKLQIASFEANGITEQQFKSVVASLEQHSSHPIAQSVYEQWSGNAHETFTDTNEIKGKGIEGTNDKGQHWQLGSAGWLASGNNNNHDLYLYCNGEYQGGITIADELRADARETIATLKQRGYKTILLSGDRQQKCEQIAKQLGIDEYFAEQSPEQKNNKVEELNKTSPTAMVGDGINDAPALARATVGISLSDSSQIAIQSANIIISSNKLASLPDALRLGIYTDQTIKQNLFWAFIYNIAAIPIAATGLLSPTWGAGLMAMSDVVLIINSLRLNIRRLK